MTEETPTKNGLPEGSPAANAENAAGADRPPHRILPGSAATDAMLTLDIAPSTLNAQKAQNPQNPPHASNAASASAQANAPDMRSASVRIQEGPRYTQAAIPMNVAVCTNSAWNILRFCYSRADIAFFRISEVIPRIAAKEEAAELRELQSAVFEEAEKDIEAAVERLEVMLRENGVPEDFRPKFSAVHKAAVDVRDRYSFRYLKLIRRMDDLCQLCDAVWLLGLMEDEFRKKVLAYWEDRLRRLSSDMFQSQRRIADAAVERRNARRLQAAAQSAEAPGHREKAASSAEPEGDQLKAHEAKPTDAENAPVEEALRAAGEAEGAASEPTHLPPSGSTSEPTSLPTPSQGDAAPAGTPQTSEMPESATRSAGVPSESTAVPHGAAPENNASATAGGVPQESAKLAQ